MLALIKYFLLNARRDKLFITIFIIMLIGLLIAYFFASTSIAEEKQMFISYSSTICRFTIIFGLINFVSNYIGRSFSQREINLILTYPISRLQFILSISISLLIICTIFVFILSCILNFVTNKDAALSVWAFSLLSESYIMTLITLALSLVLKSTLTVNMSAITFYIASRMIGFFHLLVNNIQSHKSLSGYYIELMMKKILIAITTIIPRFDLMVNSKWLIHGVENNQAINLVVIQTIIYIPFAMAICIYDVYKKEF